VCKVNIDLSPALRIERRLRGSDHRGRPVGVHELDVVRDIGLDLQA